jgi:hypothetical protein
MSRARQHSLPTVLTLGALITCFTAAALHAKPAGLEPSRQSPIDVAKAYLQAAHARDAKTAYRYISSLDRKLRDEKTYLVSQDSFGGFALEFATRLAADMEVWVIEQKMAVTKARLEVGYRIPTGDEISPRLFDWNADKLNSLSAPEQAAVIAAWENLRKTRKTVALEGREIFDLVLEKSGWKISLDWPSRSRILFKARPPGSGELAVKFLRNDLLVKIDEPFQIDFTVENRSDRDLTIKVNHLFKPRRVAENIDMIACGSLAALRLGPRTVHAISSNYLLRGPLPKSSPFSIIYEFTAQPAVVEKRKAL